MSKRPRPRFLEPYLLFSVLVAVSVGTVLLDQAPRLAFLWTTLLALSILYGSRRQVPLDFSLPAIGRGALLGLVISLPILAFLSKQLRLFTERLYATEDIVSLFYQICFISAPLEEYFFRGVVQGSKGSSAGIRLYAATALLYFLPKVPFRESVIAFIAMGVLGVVYSHVRERHGLAASIACHVAVGFVLQVVPSMIAALGSVAL